MALAQHHVFLIPGFLGIEALGDVVYFAHVKTLLEAKLREVGIEAQVHATSNYATSSLRKRASRLCEAIAERATGDGPIHLVGHSTGGLDARLLCAPDVQLEASCDVNDVARRVRTIVTVACPHHGSPLATFFTTRLGAQLLELLSLGTVYLLRFGRLPLSVVVRMTALFVRLHTRIGKLENSIANQMFEQLLGDFTAERRDELSRLFEDMAHDQTLMAQLMPEAMDVFDASVRAPSAVRCASIVAGAEATPMASALRLGLDPYAQATHALFEALRRLTREMDGRYVPSPTQAQAARLVQGLGREPTPTDNDGIVPVLSQVWGELIHVANADHFDVIGHFRTSQSERSHYDWLASACAFDQADFDALWSSVARFIADPAVPGGSP